MQIRHVIIKVDDQPKALSFYTSVVGFVKNLDRPLDRSLGSHNRSGAVEIK